METSQTKQQHLATGWTPDSETLETLTGVQVGHDGAAHILCVKAAAHRTGSEPTIINPRSSFPYVS